jgi:hypothetical protein
LEEQRTAKRGCGLDQASKPRALEATFSDLISTSFIKAGMVVVVCVFPSLSLLPPDFFFDPIGINIEREKKCPQM